jgi:Ca2+-transporting ATPase
LSRSLGRSRTAPAPPSPVHPDAAETGLHLLGLLALNDPPKPSAAATLATCRRAGITPVLITGDHPATAAAIAAHLGLLPDETTPAEDSATPPADRQAPGNRPVVTGQ